eukprot:364965-Chlamydomonas_euryale.AAC.12
MSPPSDAELASVGCVMAEMDSPNYWFHASKDGGREGHYRNGCLGLTLVHDLAAFAPKTGGGSHAGAATATAIRAFRMDVAAELPGVYTWFDDSSLHVTVRALMG